MRLKTIYYFSDASLYPHQSEGFTAPAPSTWIEVISLVYRAQRSPPSDQNRKRLKGHRKHQNLFAERNCLQIILDLMLINLHTHTRANRNFTTILGNHEHHLTHQQRLKRRGYSRRQSLDFC